MNPWLMVGAMTALGVGLLAVAMANRRNRRLVRSRLFDESRPEDRVDANSGRGAAEFTRARDDGGGANATSAPASGSLARDDERSGSSRTQREWGRLAALPIGAATGAVARLFLLSSTPLSVALGGVVALAVWQAAEALRSRRLLLLESQLADAIDLMVGALGAGAGVTAGIEAAAREAKRPLRDLLLETTRRIQLGDSPAAVFASLSVKAPLETFLLFSTALAVHYEVGGSLAPTLVNLGRTIRDRVELSRKIRSNSIQTQFSAVAVLAVTYFIAIVVWRTNPAQMAEFLRSPIASWLIAGAVLLQAIGVGWMQALSRLKF